MKRKLLFFAALALLLTMTACSSKEAAGTAETQPSQAAQTTQTTQETAENKQTAETAEKTTENTTEAAPAFETQVFECDSIKITVTGMSVLTKGNNTGNVGADFRIENKTDKKLTLPAFTEIDAKQIIGFNGYPMGKKNGDTVIWNKDHTGSFSHTWDIQDASGNVVDHLSMDLTISADLMDESAAAGTYYEKGDWSAKTAEIINDEWIKVITSDENNTHIQITNQRGKTLLIGDRFSNMQEFAHGEEISYACDPANADATTWEYHFVMADPDSKQAVGKEGNVIDYEYAARRIYSVKVSLVNGEFEVSYTKE